MSFLYPPLSTFLLSPLEVLGFAAEAALMAWLIIFGVNEQRWQERAADSA